jgi:D-3-phosphoglycerate dehydrogenase
MGANIKTVVRFEGWVHPDFLARYEREPDVELLTLDAADQVTGWEGMARAHVYQIASSRDELARHWHANAEFLAKVPNMLCISTGGAGFDTVDVPACTEAGVLVVNQAGGNARSVAEHTLGLMLDVSKRITETDRAMRERARGFPREDLMGHEISERTVGLVGFGHVGRRVAHLARAFDMNVLATDPYVDAETISAHGARKVEFDELLAASDFVSLHCPRDPSTLKMMNQNAFAKMKKGAIFITTCRGGIHDEMALNDAIRSGHIGGAGLDVWDPEPPPLDHPLLALSNVVSTFHTAGVTHEARGQMARFASDQAIDVLHGRYPPRIVNPEVWPAYAARFERIIGHRPDEK